MFVKWLLVIGIIWVVYQFFIKSKKSVATKQKSNTKKTKKDANEMVQCTACGVYVELDDAIVSNGKYFCSNECLRGK